jgi:alkyl hydroperoxide reductase subunit AhpC
VHVARFHEPVERAGREGLRDQHGHVLRAESLGRPGKAGLSLLSDYNKEAIRAYDVVNPDMIGLKNIAKRAVIVIDKGGVIRYREALDDARVTNLITESSRTR